MDVQIMVLRAAYPELQLGAVNPARTYELAREDIAAELSKLFNGANVQHVEGCWRGLQEPGIRAEVVVEVEPDSLSPTPDGWLERDTFRSYARRLAKEWDQAEVLVTFERATAERIIPE